MVVPTEEANTARISWRRLCDASSTPDEPICAVTLAVGIKVSRKMKTSPEKMKTRLARREGARILSQQSGLEKESGTKAPATRAVIGLGEHTEMRGKMRGMEPPSQDATGSARPGG